MKQIKINLSEKAMRELEALQEELGAESLAETIRSSVALTKFLGKEQSAGNDVVIRDKRSSKEKVLKGLK